MGHMGRPVALCGAFMPVLFQTMTRFLASRLLLILPFATACTFYDRESYVGRDRLEIARVQRDDGTTESYLLEVGQTTSDAALTVKTERDRERAFLGLQVVELDRASAEPRGVAPYRGLLVTGNYPRSAAVEAGVLPGDVLLAVGTEAVVYREQLPKVEAALRPEQPVTLKLLRGQQERELTIVPKALRDRVVDAEPIALEATVGRRPFAGVVLRGIPRVWCERMYGEERNAVVIAGVDVGSPAWIAGFRAGDVIDRVDQQPVGTVDELGQSLYQRGTQGGAMTLAVRRGQSESFAATIALDDYTATRQVWFPLLFRIEDGAREDEWTVGPLGLVMSNTNTYVSDPAGRKAETRDVFDAVLGLVHVDSSPRHKRLRLLWFITISL